MTMKAGLNRQLFSQVNADSGSLSMLSTVVHRFSEPGEYEGVVMKGIGGGDDIGGVITRRFTIVVVGDASSRDVAAQTETQPPHVQPGQVLIDLAGKAPDRFVLNSGGYAVFHVSAGRGGYIIQVSRFGEDNVYAKVFDNRELKDSDILSVTVIRPGTYSVTNVLNNAKAELVVNYPEPGKMQKNPQPVSVECTSNQIVPDRIRVDPSQGLVFKFKAPSRIKIDLTKPEDRTSRLRKERIIAREKILGQKKGEKKLIRRYRLVPSGK